VDCVLSFKKLQCIRFRNTSFLKKTNDAKQDNLTCRRRYDNGNNNNDNNDNNNNNNKNMDGRGREGEGEGEGEG
jgi:hypothetical protein